MKNHFFVKAAVLTVVLMLQFTAHMSAQSFHLQNQTSSHYRMRVMDRGQWGEWVQAIPGSTVTPASGVTRSSHNVEIQVFVNGEWKTVATEVRGSRAFSRVARLTSDASGNEYLSWYDEMPVSNNLVPSGSRGPVDKAAGKVYDVGKKTLKYSKKAVKWIF